MPGTSARKNKKVSYKEEDDVDMDQSGSEEENFEDIERKRIIAKKKNVESEEKDDDDYESQEEASEYQEEASEFDEELSEDDDDSEEDDSKLGKKRKAPSKVKEPKAKKETKAKEPKAGKEPKQAKEPKQPKEPKAPKEKKVKAAKEPKEPKAPKEKKEKPPKKEKFVLDPNYSLEESYFYQDLSPTEWEEIKVFVADYLKNHKQDKSILNEFFLKYPKLKKGEKNVNHLKNIVDKEFAKHTLSQSSFNSYKSLTDFLISEFFTVKPTLLECHFFPNVDNEVKVVNMLRTCKKTLDIAIFTLTNDRIFAAIEEAFHRGVKIRVIADDECCKMLGSDVVKCAALGIPAKTDSNVKAHMHHKFAILDNSVVVTGSFNWTMQAVKMNQENILFYENPSIAQQYTEEYDRLWNSFTTVINMEESRKILKEEEEKKKIAKEAKEKEKEIEKEKKRIEKEAAKKSK